MASPMIPVQAMVQGHTITCMKRNLEAEEDDAGLAWFDFESENTLAVATGTLLWDASFFIIDLLREDATAVTPSNATLSEVLRGRRVLELGAGIGLAGLCCAAAGAHVLCTDLPSIVDGIMARNITANTLPLTPPATDPPPPAARALPSTPSSQRASPDGQESQPSGQAQDSNQHIQGLQESVDYTGDEAAGNAAKMDLGLTRTGGTAPAADGVAVSAQGTPSSTAAVHATDAALPWPGARSCGRGTIASIPVDFCRTLAEQATMGCDPRAADVVIAADIVWLKELVKPLAATIAAILNTTSRDDGAGAVQEVGRFQASTATAPGDSACQSGSPLSLLLEQQPQQPSERDAGLHESHHSAMTPTALKHVGRVSPLDSACSQQEALAAQTQSARLEKVAFLAFGERATPTSTLFIALEEVCDAFVQQGCRAEVAVRQVMERVPGERMPVVLLRITAM